MKKNLRFLITGLISVTIVYIAYFVFNSTKYGYDIDLRNYNSYFWFFKDSIKTDVDTNRFVSCIRKTDILSHYIYKNTYDVFIWEFKNLDHLKLSKIAINENINLDNVKFRSGEILNRKDIPEMTVKFGSFLNNSMNINLDKYSKVEKSINSVNYRGFYGSINRMSFSNEKDEHLVLFNYLNGKEPSLLLLYKGHSSFYVILINSEEPFDVSLIKILNLE